MTGPPAKAAEAEAARPDNAEKRINPEPLGRRKYLRVLPEDALELKPLYEGPAPKTGWDGTSSVPPPANAMTKSRYAMPLLIEPPEAPKSIPEAIQILEAEQHARRVSLGLCWQEEHDLEPFEETSFTYGDIELPPEAVWTSDQKYQFIELLGRRSAANLASIAETLGKPLLDCEIYLKCLRSGAEAVPFDTEDVPMASEADESTNEYMILENEDYVLGGVTDDKGECLLHLDRLEVRTDHSFGAQSAEALVKAVKQKVRTLITNVDRMEASDTPQFKSLEELMEKAPRKLLGFCRADEELRPLYSPVPGTGPLPYDSGLVTKESESSSKETDSEEDSEEDSESEKDSESEESSGSEESSA